MLTKPPAAGRVKTRLIGELDASQAAQLHWAFVEDLGNELAGKSFSLVIAWALQDGEATPILEGVELDGCLTQSGSTLGERIYNALRAAAARFEFVVAVGSDHPELSADTVAKGLGRLESGDADVVIGPSDDGGYYLIGSRSSTLNPRLFANIAWSTDAVLEQTRERCIELGLRVDLLEVVADIDTPDDLRALCRRLRGPEGLAGLDADPERAPRSRGLLHEWAWL